MGVVEEKEEGRGGGRGVEIRRRGRGAEGKVPGGRKDGRSGEGGEGSNNEGEGVGEI